MPPQTHFALRYHRPSWQGGDAHQALCMAPAIGWAGPVPRGDQLTEEPELVTCEACGLRLWKVEAA